MKPYLHHFGSWPLSFQVDELREHGLNFPEVEAWGDRHVNYGN